MFQHFFEDKNGEIPHFFEDKTAETPCFYQLGKPLFPPLLPVRSIRIYRGWKQCLKCNYGRKSQATFRPIAAIELAIAYCLGNVS